MWGQADVGADIFAALGLVMAAAQGAANLSFALAGLVYIMIGLAYTELASAYPVAGGGQYFTLRGLGDFWGYITGVALLLDYTIDIALFSVACTGYINFFFPAVFGQTAASFLVTLGPLKDINWVWCLESVVVIVVLLALNLRGIRESSLLNEVIGVVGILAESGIVIMGFLFAWQPELLALQWKTQFPTLTQFMYSSSLAIISFVGLESISQAAQETRRPATVIPRTSVTLIFTVFIFSVAFSTLGLGMPLDPAHPGESWKILGAAQGESVAILAKAIPYIGIIAGPLAAVLGAVLLFISANSGIMSASRLTYSMSQFRLLPRWFDKVHAKFHTPVRTIVVFTLIGLVQTVLAFLSGVDPKNGQPRALEILGNMYAFGATLGYLLVFISIIKLRFSDPYTPRPYRMPLNIPVRYRGRTVDVPIMGFIGALGVSSIFFTVIWTHAIGRIAGPLWVLLWLGLFIWYRRYRKLPVLKSLPRDWEQEQIAVLTSAEEFDLLEQYKQALLERNRQRARERELGKR
jgi:APA family basic amino acid/polyamine antiporter